MPYIKQNRREELATDFEGPINAGELNYLLTLMLIKAADEDEVYTKARFIVNAYMLINGKSYQKMNDVFGALVGAAMEYQRRMGTEKYRNVMGRVLDHFYYEVTAPYENEKIKENGDVYDVK